MSARISTVWGSPPPPPSIRRTCPLPSTSAERPCRKSCRRDPVQHQADCGDGDQGLRGLHPALIILRQATIETEPREAALDDPCQSSDRENTLPAPEDSQLPAIAPELAGELVARVASIRDDRADRRPKRRQAGQQPEAGNGVRHVRLLNAVWRAEGRAHRPECGVSV